MKKIIITIFVTFVLALSLTACGSAKKTESSPASQEGTSDQEKVDKDEGNKETTGDDSAVTDEDSELEEIMNEGESVEVMVPEGPIEEMEPEESVEIEIEEGQQGALG